MLFHSALLSIISIQKGAEQRVQTNYFSKLIANFMWSWFISRIYIYGTFSVLLSGFWSFRVDIHHLL